MTTSSIIQESFAEHVATVQRSQARLADSIEKIGRLLSDTLASGGTIFWCGNGGSAADSQHLATELVARFKGNRRALRSIALTTDTSVLTGVSNDFGYDDVFARQLEALGRPQDLLVAITTSGSSENVLSAIRAAAATGMVTVGFLGRDGGAAAGLVDHALVVPSDATARIQETHILIGHTLCEIIERELGLA